jgi:hypothetical protein
VSRYVWLIALALPIWAAAELEAPKWVLMLTAIPFFLRAATLGDPPDEQLLGEGFAQYRPSVLVALGVGGLILGAGLLMLAKVLF